MATFGPPLRDSASQYGKIYANPDERFAVQNARVNRGDVERSLSSRPSEDGRRKRTSPRYQGQFESDDEESALNKRVEERYTQQQSVQQPNTVNRPSKIKTKTHVSLAVKNEATIWFMITNSWSLTIWGFVQVWAGIASSMFFGIAIAVSDTFINDAVTTVAEWFGYTQPNLIAIGFWGLITAAAIGWISLLIAAMHAKIWLLHPLMGDGATFKKGTFLLAIVLYAVPLLNMVPWICLWTVAVRLNPK